MMQIIHGEWGFRFAGMSETASLRMALDAGNGHQVLALEIWADDHWRPGTDAERKQLQEALSGDAGSEVVKNPDHYCLVLSPVMPAWASPEGGHRKLAVVALEFQDAGGRIATLDDASRWLEGLLLDAGAQVKVTAFSTAAHAAAAEADRAGCFKSDAQILLDFPMDA